LQSRVVGAKGQVELLAALSPGLSLDEAVSSAALAKRKVAGRWVYADSEATIARASELLGEQAEHLLKRWLIVPLRILAGSARKEVADAVIEFEAAEPLLKGLMQDGAFLEVGMLTAEHAPYLAVASHRDADELELQVEFVRARMLDGDVLSTSDLLPPLRGREMRAWQGSVLRHAEFLGLGATDGSELVPWRRL
jgi:hypothetical protein